MINPVKEALDRTFPETPTQKVEMSGIEKQVQECVEKFIIKGCEYWESTGNKLSKVRDIYRACWIPYYALKSPLAYRHKLHGDIPEKNLEVITNITATNVALSVMTPGVYRKVPWTAMMRIDALAHGINKLASASLVTVTFIHYPAYRTFTCITKGLIATSSFFTDLQRTAGECLDRQKNVYLGPEAFLGVMTSLAVGTAIGLFSHLILSIVLRDNDKTERYQTLLKIYQDVAMVMKKQWDEAFAAKDKTKMLECATQAKKLTANLTLITGQLGLVAVLTDKQIANIINNLTWGCQYVLLQYQSDQQNENLPINSPTAKVEAPKEEASKQTAAVKQEAPKQEVPKQEAPKVEVPKQEVPKVEVPKVEASKQTAVVKQEAPKQETTPKPTALPKQQPGPKAKAPITTGKKVGSTQPVGMKSIRHFIKNPFC